MCVFFEDLRINRIFSLFFCNLHVFHLNHMQTQCELTHSKKTKVHSAKNANVQFLQVDLSLALSMKV